MKYKCYFIIIIFLLFNPLIAGSEQFRCTADKTTGFRYNGNSKIWEITEFISENKFIITKSDKNGYSYKIVKSGEKEPSCLCKGEFNDHGYLFCKGYYGTEFRFNKNNGRYIFSFLMAYYNVLPNKNQLTDKDSGTPYIEIGKCSPF